MEVLLTCVTDLWARSIAHQVHLSPALTLSPIEEGYSTAVYQIMHESGNRILRFYPPAKKSRFEGYLSAHRTFSDLGIRVPRIEAWGAAPEGNWVVEEKIEGTSFRHLVEEPSAQALAATTLAKLHSHTRDRYGEIRTWGGFRLPLRWRQRFPERWAKVTRLLPELEETTEKVSAWYRDWSESYSPSTYHLLHNDFHPGNLILTPDREVALLDLRSPRYGLGLMELIEAAHHFTGEELSDWTPFLDPYLQTSSASMGESFEKYGEGCHAVFHLRQADRFADLALGNRGTLVDRRKWEEYAYDSWERFCRISGVVGPVLNLPRSPAFKRGCSTIKPI